MAEPSNLGVFIDTYGCQMNVLDSELVTGQLTARGYHLVDKPEDAGVVLLNTCSVRALSEQKVWSQLGRLGILKREAKPELVIGVLGCMAEREGGSIASRMPHVDIVCGPSNLDRLPALIDNVKHNQGVQLSLAGHTSRRSQTREAAMDGVESLDLSRAFSAEANKFQAYVRVTRGCNKFCSFCVVPYTRGPEVHRAPALIIEEVRRLTEAGALEVTLIGQTVNHYAYEDGGVTTSFADLLWQIHEAVPELPRLRFVTSYPRDFGDDILDVMAQAPRLCRYLHLPAQSGSNRLLKLMNRGYEIELYESLIERARQKLPDVCLAGDMIVGFPTETDAEHQASLALLRRARYKNVFVFKYSPREGTVAARRLADDVPEELKKARNLEMLDVQAELTLAHNQARVGQLLSVLVESESKLRAKGPSEVQLGWSKRVRLLGRTPGDEIVAFDGPPELVGKIVPVRAIQGGKIIISGEFVARPTPTEMSARP